MATEKRWEEMTARERDALVAEKVMGWEVVWGKTWTETDWETSDYPTEAHGPGRLNWTKENRPRVTTFNPPIQAIPAYSEDIAAAWEVVEKMGRHVRVETWQELGEGVVEFMWMATVWGDGGAQSRGVARSAPEAICIAALRAKGVDV